MAYSKKLNLVFIHIPKNAGTSIIEAMRELDPTVDHGHKTWAAYDRYDIKVNKPLSFAIVRNPWDRVFSCYNYALKKESYWHGPDKKYGMHPDHALLSQYDFKDCVKMLYHNRALLDKPAGARPNFKDNWDHQWKYIYDDHALKVNQVLRYEFFDEVTDYLWSVHLLKVPKLNTSTDGLDYRDAYDDEMIDLVAQVYKEDIDRFNYEF